MYTCKPLLSLSAYVNPSPLGRPKLCYSESIAMLAYKVVINEVSPFSNTCRLKFMIWKIAILIWLYSSSYNILCNIIFIPESWRTALYHPTDSHRVLNVPYECYQTKEETESSQTGINNLATRRQELWLHMQRYSVLQTQP